VPTQALPYDAELLQQQLDGQEYWDRVPLPVMQAVQAVLTVVRLPHE